MGMKARIFFALFFLFSATVFVAQVSTFKLHLVRGLLRKPVKNQNVKVVVGDTLSRKMISDEKGQTGYLELPEGKYNITVLVDNYRPRTKRNVKIERAGGRHLTFKLKREGKPGKEEEKTLKK
jgi:hypothetical protein